MDSFFNPEFALSPILMPSDTPYQLIYLGSPFTFVNSLSTKPEIEMIFSENIPT